MVIGIVDLDYLLPTCRRQYQLNLDVMQIAAYHRKIGDKVKYCYSMAPENLSWYSQLYVIYNGEQEVYIDKLLSDDRVTVLGKYFYGNYCALPQCIRDTFPDRTFYFDIVEKGDFSKTKRSDLRARLKHSDFVRLHEPSNKNFITDNSEIIFYDLDISDNDYKAITELNKEFSLYYPIQLRCYSNAEKWMNAKAFNKLGGAKIFIAIGFTETDLYKIVELPSPKRRMFQVRFGECDKTYYNFELKKCLRVLQKSRLYDRKFSVQIAPINDFTYDFLFKCALRWYNSSKTVSDNIDIFHEYFNNKNKFELIIKIKAKDPELYQLLTFTLTQGVSNERAKKDYRRVD